MMHLCATDKEIRKLGQGHTMTEPRSCNHVGASNGGDLHGQLDVEQARRILWMYTSRDVYRMRVQDGGWSPQRYQEWLSRTLVEALVEPV